MQDKSTTQIAFRLNGKDISFKTSMNREDSERIRNKFASNFPKVAQMVEQSPKKYYGDFGALLMTAVEIIEFEVGRYNDTDKHLGELENDLKRIAPEYAEKFENERRKLEEDFDIAAKRAQEERDSQIKLLTEDFERKESDYKDRLTDLGRKLSETETAFEKLKQDNALTNTDMSKAREAHAELKSKSDNLQRELVGAKTEADSTAAALKLLQENVEKKIEDEKTKLADELNTRHLRERSDLTKEVAELTGRISAVTSENAALNTARAALLSEQQNFIAQQNTKYTDLLNKLTGEKAAFVEKTESDIALDRERFAKELAEKQVTVEIAIQKTNEKDAEIADIKRDAVEKVAVVEKRAEERIADIRRETDEKIAPLTTENENLKAQIAEKDGEIKDLSRYVESNAEVISSTETELTVLKTEVDKAKNALEQAVADAKQAAKTETDAAISALTVQKDKEIADEKARAEKAVSDVKNENEKTRLAFEKQAAEKDAIINGLKRDYSEFEKKLAEKDYQISDFDVKLRKERTEQDAKLNSALSSALSEMEQIASERERKAETLQAALIEYEKLIAAQSEELDIKNRQLSGQILRENMVSAEDEMLNIAMIKDEQNRELREKVMNYELQISTIMDESERKINELEDTYESAKKELLSMAEQADRNAQDLAEKQQKNEILIQEMSEQLAARNASVFINSAQEEYSHIADERDLEAGQYRENLHFMEQKAGVDTGAQGEKLKKTEDYAFHLMEDNDRLKAETKSATDDANRLRKTLENNEFAFQETLQLKSMEITRVQAELNSARRLCEEYRSKLNELGDDPDQLKLT